MDRRTLIDTFGAIARYKIDLIRLDEKREEILNRYKGAIASQPIGHSTNDQRTGDPEARHLELEKLEHSSLAKRIEAVGLAFNDMRHYTNSKGWLPDQSERLVDAIIANCDNRKSYSIMFLIKHFNIPCSERTFKREKSLVVLKVAEKLDL